VVSVVKCWNTPNGEELVKLVRLIAPFALALLVLPSCGGSHAKKSESKRISATSDLVIVATGDSAQHRIGSYHYKRAHALPGGDYASAVKSFGESNSSRRDGILCHTRWSKLGLEIDFANVPGPCTVKALEKRGLWYGAGITSRRWRTDRGLRVGDSKARLRALYPKARLSGQGSGSTSWTLAHKRDQEIDLPLLVAVLRGDRVTAIVTPADYIY